MIGLSNYFCPCVRFSARVEYVTGIGLSESYLEKFGSFTNDVRFRSLFRYVACKKGPIEFVTGPCRNLNGTLVICFKIGRALIFPIRTVVLEGFCAKSDLSRSNLSELS